MKSKTGNISNSVFSSANLSLTIKIDTRPFRKPGEAPTLAMIHGRVRARHCVNIGPTIKTVPQPTRCDAKGRLRKFRLFAALGWGRGGEWEREKRLLERVVASLINSIWSFLLRDLGRMIFGFWYFVCYFDRLLISSICICVIMLNYEKCNDLI